MKPDGQALQVLMERRASMRRERGRLSDDELLQLLRRLQSIFIQTGNRRELVDVTTDMLAWHFNVDSATVRRKLSRLTIEVNGEAIPAQDLVPGPQLEQQWGCSALQDLSTDPVLYSHGRWLVSQDKLAELLKERFGLRLARRTVSKYLVRIGKGSRRAHRLSESSDDPMIDLRNRYPTLGTLMKDIDASLLARLRRAGRIDEAKKYLYFRMFDGDPLAYYTAYFGGTTLSRAKLWQHHPRLAAALKLQGTLEEALRGHDADGGGT